MGCQGANLVWSPVASHLVSRCENEGGVRLLVAPFIQRDAFRHMLDRLSSHSDLKVITRWNASDLASGASDPFVFEECRERRVPLYLHERIHLKLVTMGSGICFCGSANITATGLGLHDQGNVEAGTWVLIGPDDWRHLYEIVHSSRLVDDAVFDAAVGYREEFLHAAPPLPPLELPLSPPSDLTLASLPATLTPQDVLAIADGSGPETGEDVDVNRQMHDLVHFGVPWNGDRDAFLLGMGGRFLAHAFVREVIEHVRSSGSLRFGEMVAWIHSRCRDVPVPFRWEVKHATSALYNWLAFYVPEISWSVPGQRSQVIVWTDTR